MKEVEPSRARSESTAIYRYRRFSDRLPRWLACFGRSRKAIIGSVVAAVLLLILILGLALGLTLNKGWVNLNTFPSAAVLSQTLCAHHGTDILLCNITGFP